MREYMLIHEENRGMSYFLEGPGVGFMRVLCGYDQNVCKGSQRGPQNPERHRKDK